LNNFIYQHGYYGQWSDDVITSWRKVMDEAIGKLQVQEGEVIRCSRVGKNDIESMLEIRKKDGVWRNKSFMSCSFDENIAQGFTRHTQGDRIAVKYHIKTKEANSINDISNQNEKETLFNTHKDWKIVMMNKTEDSYGLEKWDIWLEDVPIK
jgi:predicted glycosyl hydrolase (DUF1957 family)